MSNFGVLSLMMLGFLWHPSLSCADDLTTSPCVEALEQVETLETWVPIYQQLPAERRRYLKDSERPAELARIQQLVSISCSTDPHLRAAQQTAAAHLHTARSPECAIERDKLTAMLRPDSREANSSIAQQRQLVAAECPVVRMSGVWLLQMVWAKP
jgi:hypothetical protein